MLTMSRTAILCVLFSMFSVSVWAQTGGTVTGTVADETGGVLPGVSVSLRAGSQAAMETVTDGMGGIRSTTCPRARRSSRSA